MSAGAGLPAARAEIPGEPTGNSIRDVVGRRWDAIKAGDVGTLPVILGLILIVAFFYSKNSNFLTAGNFTNLLVQMAGTTTIAIGVVFVLLLGEIDLSISYVSGVAGVIVALMQDPTGRWQTGGIVAILVALALTALIGALQGSFVALIGVPAFVVTLAGFMFWQGVILKAIGVKGVIVIQDTWINDTANYFFPDFWGWVIAIAASLIWAGTVLTAVFSRRRHGIFTDNALLVALKIGFVAVVALGATWWANKERGLPLALVIVIVALVFWTYVAERTTFGRHVYAVGGNEEAARRAGINVTRIKVIVFMISSGMAGLGGIILAARLTSVDLNAGGGDLLLSTIAAAVIGGTSLFGGRGRVINALMGALVLSTVANGIDLVGYSSAIKYMVTGVILLAAVTLDTISKRRLAASGR